MPSRAVEDQYNYTKVIELIATAACQVKRAATHTEKIVDPAKRALAIRKLDDGVEKLRMYAVVPK